MHTTFINYSDADEVLAKRIYADLLAGGVRPWLAIYDMLPGQTRQDAQPLALGTSEYVIVLLTKKFQRDEDENAVLDKIRQTDKIIIPVIADRGIKVPDDLPDGVQLKRRYADAIAELIALLPSDAEPLEELPALQIGNEAYHLTDYEGALEVYEDLEDIESGALLLHCRAAAYNALRQHDKALEDLNKAVELKPDSPLLYRNRSVALGGVGDHEAALEDDKKALEFDDKDPRNWSNYAMTLTSLSRFDEAQEKIDKAVELVPDDVRYVYQSGVIRTRAGKTEEALALFERALTIDPSHNDAEIWRQIVLGRMGKHDEAFERINKAIKKNPRQGGNYITRSLLNFYMEHYEDAAKDATAALERSADNQVSAFYNRAISNWKLGNQDQAIEDLAQAVNLYPTLGTEAGIRNNTDSEITANPGLEILAAIEAKAEELGG